jgi:nucleotide-binding universal stress UspA family protein
MQPGLPWWDADIAEANDYLADVAETLGKEGLSVTTEVLLGDDVATSIIDYAERKGADLLAIATSGAGGFKRLVFGSVADEVARRSQTSLLVVHAVDRAERSQLEQEQEHKPFAAV